MEARASSSTRQQALLLLLPACALAFFCVACCFAVSNPCCLLLGCTPPIITISPHTQSRCCQSFCPPPCPRIAQDALNSHRTMNPAPMWGGYLQQAAIACRALNGTLAPHAPCCNRRRTGTRTPSTSRIASSRRTNSSLWRQRLLRRPYPLGHSCSILCCGRF